MWGMQAQIKELEVENADLKARLKKALEQIEKLEDQLQEVQEKGYGHGV